VWSTAGDVYSYAMTLESSLQHFEGLPEGLLALLTLATVEDPKLRPTLPALLADLEREAAAHPGTELLEIRPPVDVMERRKLGGVRRTIEKRRRQVFLQTAVMAMFVLVTLGSAGLAAKCMVAPQVEQREPSIERAIELAEAGDPLGAMLEYFELDQESIQPSPADLNRLAQCLLDSTTSLHGSNAAAAASLAEMAATQALMVARQEGDAVMMEKAQRLRVTAHAIVNHN